MMHSLQAWVKKNQRFLPISATAFLVVVAYVLGAIFFPGMRNPQVFLNLFRNNAYLLISAVGMTLVILTGGIDLSVSGVIALTTVASAALLRGGMDPWLVILLMLLMGMALGAVMGSFIAFMKVQPFIATLAGMWFSRGMCFVISDDAIAIDDRLFKILGQTKILIPGLAEIAEGRGQAAPYISIFVVVAFLLLGIGIYVAQYTRFGRTIYAIGGNEGRNEQSARLMGLPVERTKLLVYTVNGLCSGLAGLALATFVSSGHGLYANGFEMDAIASVVIGGTMLTGGTGYVFGTLFGVMVLAITQVLIQFIGSLSSWWTRIVIGLLTLLFIGVQSIFAARRDGEQQQDERMRKMLRQRRRSIAYGGGALLILVVAAVIFVPPLLRNNAPAATQAVECQVGELRESELQNLIDSGAVIAYQRLAGPRCVDEVYAVYPDGTVSGDDGQQQVEIQVAPTEIETILRTAQDDYGWFTDNMYSTWHNPCGTCYAHYLIIAYQDQEKAITAVDGGVDMQAEYGYTLSILRPILPKFGE